MNHLTNSGDSTRQRPGNQFIGTMVICLLSLMTACSPSLQQLVQFDANAVWDGQFWRFFTGHLTHWNSDHFVWDFMVFLLLGVLCERQGRSAFLATVFGSAAVVSTCLLIGLADVHVYRGLSGIDTGLFGLWSTRLLIQSWTNQDRTLLWLAGTAYTAMMVKIGWELVTGATMFVDHASAEFIPVPLAHVAGAVCGSVVAGMELILHYGRRRLPSRGISHRMNPADARTSEEPGNSTRLQPPSHLANC